MLTSKQETIVGKLEALTAGPTPLLHSVRLTGDMLSVHIQPWGNAIYLNWQQAEMFVRDLPLEAHIPRKHVRSQTSRIHRRQLHG